MRSALADLILSARHTDRRVERAAIIAVVLVYVVVGLIGHDPWKQDETYATSIIHHMDQTEDWVVPQSAGRPFMEKPPLYFLVAEETVDVFDWLPLHDAARLSNVLWMFMVIACIAVAGRIAWPEAPNADIGAVLALISSLGLVVHAHTLLVDVALVAGFALGLLGALLVLRRPMLGGMLFGTGAGVAFLAKGLLGPGCLAASMLFLVVLFERWRSRSVAKGMAVAVVAMLPWLVVWPLALHDRSPALFDEWLWQQNVGRFLGYAHLGAAPEPWYYFRTAPAFTFPVVLFAAWTVWTRRRTLLGDAPLQLCVVAAATIFATLSVAGSMRALYLLPLLVPLALLAGAGVETLPPSWQRRSAAAAYGVYSALAMALWLLYLAIAGDAIPEWLATEGIVPRGSVAQPEALSVMAAVLVSLAWLANSRWTTGRLLALRNWAFGLSLVWVLVATLHMPWINEAKSYRAMFEEMKQQLPTKFDCVKSYRLGESEAAMLEYEGGITTVRAEDHPDAQCQLFWLQGGSLSVMPSSLRGWRLVWSGHRLGDKKELHRLFARGD